MNNPRRIQRHLVKALAAGAVLVAAAMPLVIATAAGAAPVPVSVAFTAPGTGNSFGSGASGTATVTGTGFINDGGNVTIASSAPGLTFTGAIETSATSATASYASTSATVPGTYSLSITDDGGTNTANNAIVVNADPSFTSVSPTGIVDLATPTPTTVTVTGAGFVTGATVTFTSVTNGTTLASTEGTGGAFTGGKVSTGTQGESTFGSATSLTVSVDPTNSVTGGPATTGAYTVTVTNPDGGSTTSGSVFTITGNEISEVTPSAVADVAGTTAITVTGSGFASSATLTLGTCTGVTLGSTGSVSGATTITDTVIVTGTPATTTCSLTVNNVSPGNGATYTAAGAIGVGIASLIAPTITASSLGAATAVLPGTPAQTITFTGTGFSQFTAPVSTLIGTSATADTHASIGTTAASCLGGQSGTSLTCELTVTGGAATGAHSAVLENTSATTAFPAAFSVAGPVITSAAPVALAVGAPVGTIVALTGTGFGPTTTGAITASVGTAPVGVFQNISATQENFVVTSPVAGTSTDAITVSSVDAYGDSSTSAPLAFAVEAAPTVTSTTYVTGTTGVGVGATAQTITVNGSGFATGATLGSFVNTAAVADPDVAGTVVTVNAAGTQLTATIAIAAGDTNTIDGFTVTNTNGGTTKATAAAPAGLVINAAPTLTGVSPTTATPSGTTAFTFTGTGFQTGATVRASSDGTCGTATVASATSITASCTLGAASATPVTLIVSNPDGGSATSTAVLTAVVPAPKGPHATHVNGSAVTGKTVTITISGSGFAGAPKITSNAAGTTAKASHDTGKLLTVRISTKAGKGEHVLTIRNADGKSCKIGYATKA
jgi:hypothetical protein